MKSVAVIVTAGCLISAISFGVRAGFGLFLDPMSVDLGWGREVFALSLAIQNLVWGLGQPFAGAIADRYGSGRVLAGGGAIYAAGVVLMSVSSTPLSMHLTAGVMVGLGISGASFAVVLAALSRLVPPEKVGWAMGIGTAAGSLGQFLVVPLGQAFLAAYGWPTALLLLGVVAAFMIPLAGALTGKPGKVGREQTMSQALREAGGHRGYWLLLSGFFVCGFHVAFIQVHLPAYLTGNGLSPATAAYSLAVIGLFNIAGAYAAGTFAGRFRDKKILSGIYLVRAVAIAAYVLLPISVWSTYAFCAVMGLLWLSTVPLTSSIVVHVFGPRYVGTLFGIVFFSHQIGAFVGVWLGGRVYDATGSYLPVWWAAAALGAFAALVNLPIDDRKLVAKEPVSA
ncbi:MAG: MFS transporter [Proteobacteria bacterium]|nr:MFS transporter [Pseudomonadota bacterium]